MDFFTEKIDIIADIRGPNFPLLIIAAQLSRLLKHTWEIHFIIQEDFIR